MTTVRSFLKTFSKKKKKKSNNTKNKYQVWHRDKRAKCYVFSGLGERVFNEILGSFFSARLHSKIVTNVSFSPYVSVFFRDSVRKTNVSIRRRTSVRGNNGGGSVQ